MQLQDEDNRLGRSQPQWFDTENQLQAKTPQILLLPSGEITPFSLTLQEKESDGILFRQINGLAWLEQRDIRIARTMQGNTVMIGGMA